MAKTPENKDLPFRLWVITLISSETCLHYVLTPKSNGMRFNSVRCLLCSLHPVFAFWVDGNVCVRPQYQQSSFSCVRLHLRGEEENRDFLEEHGRLSVLHKGYE